jgi:hypothetical protein
MWDYLRENLHFIIERDPHAPRIAAESRRQRLQQQVNEDMPGMGRRWALLREALLDGRARAAYVTRIVRRKVRGAPVEAGTLPSPELSAARSSPSLRLGRLVRPDRTAAPSGESRGE